MIGITSTEPPKVLYHYCSTESFYGIITSKNIRLSNCIYSNDPNENKISKNILVTVSQKSDDKNVRDFAKKVLEFELIDDMGAYIFCMSEKADDLNQWRIYGDTGFGFMIGLNTSYFLENKYWILDDSNVVFPYIDRIYLGKCIYDLGLQTEIIEFWIKMFLEEMSNVSEEQKILKLKHILQFYSAIFKHESYSEEKEWRLVCFPIFQNNNQNKKIKYPLRFIPKRGFISQFIQMDYMEKSEFENTPFESVVLGPNVLNDTSEIMDFTKYQGENYAMWMKKSNLKMRPR